MNFVIVGPVRDPRWRVVDPTVRGESSTAFSTVRYHLEDAEGRRIRVKQNFNDWWIPTVCDISLRQPGAPLVVGDDVAYLGRDYKRHAGACFHRHGTQVEFSLEQGSMSTEEWAGLVFSFDAFVPRSVGEARASTFARRNYWNRWGRIEAPWDTREISRLRWEDCSSDAFERIAWATAPDRWAQMPGAPDSVGTARYQGLEEAQVVFRNALTLNSSAWLRVLRGAGKAWRSLMDQSEVNRPRWEPCAFGGQTVRRACMNPEVGNWYYAWQAGERSFELHLRARAGFSAIKADAVAAALLD